MTLTQLRDSSGEKSLTARRHGRLTLKQARAEKRKFTCGTEGSGRGRTVSHGVARQGVSVCVCVCVCVPAPGVAWHGQAGQEECGVAKRAGRGARGGRGRGVAGRAAGSWGAELGTARQG